MADRKYTDREILERLRAEFDWLWEKYNMGSHCGPEYKPYEFHSQLHHALNARFREADLPAGSCGTEGIVGWQERQKDA